MRIRSISIALIGNNIDEVDHWKHRGDFLRHNIIGTVFHPGNTEFAPKWFEHRSVRNARLLQLIVRTAFIFSGSEHALDITAAGMHDGGWGFQELPLSHEPLTE